MRMRDDDAVIRVRDLVVGFGDADRARPSVARRARAARFSASSAARAAGKSVLMRTIIGLIPKRAGTIEVFGVDLDRADEARAARGRAPLGRALPAGRAVLLADRSRRTCSSRCASISTCPERLMDEMAMAKLEMVGLDARRRRQASRRALRRHDQARGARPRAGARSRRSSSSTSRPPGLDPIAAGDFDALIRTLQQTLGLTVFMVTHDLDSLYTVCDRIAALADGRIVAEGPMATMLASEHPWVQAYFHGKRGGSSARTAAQTED